MLADIREQLARADELYDRKYDENNAVAADTTLRTMSAQIA